jgi:outer membrane protein assembly factor BamB
MICSLRGFALVLIVGSLGLTVLNGGDASGTAWTLFRGDSNMTGVSADPVRPPLELAWSCETGAPVPATPVIGGGKVFVGSLGGKFYCLELATGKILWTFPTKLGVEGSACLTGDLVCFGETDGFVRALRVETGEEVWHYETADAIVGGVNRYRTRAGRELILVGSDDFFLHAIDAQTGQKVWAVETGNYIKGAPSVDADAGLVIFGGCDEILRLIDAETGEPVRTIPVGAYMANSCAVRDKIAYVAHYAGDILAFDLTKGETVWTNKNEGVEFVASPAVDPQLVVVGGRDKKLRALDRSTGAVVWEFLARKGIDSSAVLGPEVIYVGADDGRLYAIDRKDGKELWSYEIGARLNSSPAVASGFVIIGAQDGGIYAFRAAGAGS